MPRNVRNSWVDLYVDGRRTSVHTGPRSKDGRMDATFRVRHEGSIKGSVDVRTSVMGNRLTLTVSIAGQIVLEHRTLRDPDPDGERDTIVLYNTDGELAGTILPRE